MINMDDDMDNVVRRRREEEEIDEDESEPENEPEVVPVASATRQATISFYISFVITCVIAVIVCVVAYQTSPITALPINDILPVEFVGSFSLNYRLSKGKRIGMNSPESVVEDDAGNLYTGLRDGRIVKISPSLDGIIGEGEMVNLTSGEVLDSTDVTVNIGHVLPLGIRLRNDTLFVVDAISGLYSLNVITGKSKVLLQPSDASPSMKFPNDLDITSNGSILYFTDSSSTHPITDLIEETLEGGCSGRLFKYDLMTKKLDAVVKNLCFANGVQLTKDEKMIMVSETSRYRVLWIDTKTWKTRHLLHLPATPDNIRKNKHGSYWVAGSAKFSKPLQLIFNHPALRQTLVGLLPHSTLMSFANRKHNMLFEVNDYGEIFDTWHDPTGNLTFALAQGTELSDGRIALSTYAAPYLAIAKKPI